MHAESKGYTVRSQLSPFIGAFKVFDLASCTNTPSIQHRVADYQGANVTNRTAPFSQIDDLKTNEILSVCLSRLIVQTLYAVASPNRRLEDTFLADPDISNATKRVAAHMGTRFLLVVVAHGRITSMGESLGQALPQAIGIAILTGGMVSGARFDVSYLDTYLALVDLDSAEVLWTDSRRMQVRPFDLSSPQFYSERWSPFFLPNLPKQEQGELK
jgi:hypothetical protein